MRLVQLTRRGWINRNEKDSLVIHLSCWYCPVLTWTPLASFFLVLSRSYRKESLQCLSHWSEDTVLGQSSRLFTCPGREVKGINTKLTKYQHCPMAENICLIGRACDQSQIPGVPSLLDLRPDDLRWSWCTNNRDKACNKCDALESFWNQSDFFSVHLMLRGSTIQ